jgi:hypothetical protein
MITAIGSWHVLMYGDAGCIAIDAAVRLFTEHADTSVISVRHCFMQEIATYQF